MKSLKFIITAVLAVFMSVQIYAQTPKTETFKVSGNCNMCKATIEKAAKSAGVTKADWDVKAKVISVTYDPSKVKAEDIHKKIAASGYDTEKVKASDAAYNKLHSCCKYKRS